MAPAAVMAMLRAPWTVWGTTKSSNTDIIDRILNQKLTRANNFNATIIELDVILIVLTLQSNISFHCVRNNEIVLVIMIRLKK